MPTDRVRRFDAAKGYGFITSEEGRDAFPLAQALPTGVTTLRKGAKVECSVVDGRRRPQAIGARLITSVPNLVKITRPKADDIAAICGDLIKMLDTAGNTLCRHCYLSAADSKKLATLLCTVAN